MAAGRVTAPGSALLQFEILRTLWGETVKPLVVWVTPEENFTSNCDCKILYRLDRDSYQEARKHYGKRARGRHVCLHMGRLVE